MSSRDKTPYAKPKSRSSKIIGGGGPRDMQRRQQNTGVLSGPKLDINDLQDIKKIIEEKLEGFGAPDSILDGIPLEEVEKRIITAVRVTREEEAARYESGLKSLNDQLNAAKIKIGLMEKELESKINDSNEELIETLKRKIRSKDAEIRSRDKRIKELDSESKGTNVSEEINNQITIYKKEVAELKIFLEEKEELIMSLNAALEEKMVELESANTLIKQLQAKTDMSNDSLVEMKKTMQLMFEKLTNLQIVDSENNGGPSIEDHKVFIDPTESKEGLKPHIDIEATRTIGDNRNMKSDIDKLRALVGKGKYIPSKAKSDLID